MADLGGMGIYGDQLSPINPNGELWGWISDKSACGLMDENQSPWIHIALKSAMPCNYSTRWRFREKDCKDWDDGYGNFYSDCQWCLLACAYTVECPIN